MMLLGQAVFKCPIDDKEVTLDKDCINCKHFQHWGVRGAKPYVSCNYKNVITPKQTEPEEKKKGIGGLHRW